jgi:universal stress protein A
LKTLFLRQSLSLAKKRNGPDDQYQNNSHSHGLLYPCGTRVKYAGELAKNLKAKAYVLHVAQYSNVGGDPDASELLIPNYIPELERKGKELLEQITLKLQQDAVDAHSVFVAGRASRDILRMAQELKVDLIVLGTHGRTGFSHLFFESTAEKVVRLCPYPVLTVKHPDYALEKESKSMPA